MADGITILVGTAGQGVMRSVDSGQSWRRVGITQGIHSDAVVRCLTPMPGSDSAVLAGCDRGIIRSDDNGDSWHAVDTPHERHRGLGHRVRPVQPAGGIRRHRHSESLPHLPHPRRR